MRNKPPRPLTLGEQIGRQKNAKEMELKNPVKRLKLEFRSLTRHYPDYDFIQRFQEFCRQKNLTESEITNLIQNHLTIIQ